MLAGDLYDASDPQLVADRLRARTLCCELNALPPQAAGRQREILSALFPGQPLPSITPPFFCDYGYNIVFGENVYFNVNCVVLDVARVAIGGQSLFGPAVQLYAATHPLRAEERRSGLELGAPVAIGDEVWVGGGAVVCPGVSIGSGSVIGAGSVVVHSVPQGVLAAGNPCRVIRKL